MNPVLLALVLTLGIRSHVLTGVAPEESYTVTANGQEIAASPAWSDTNGVLCFAFEDSALAPGPIAMFVCFTPDSTATGIEVPDMMLLPEDALRWAWAIAPVWVKLGWF